MAFEASNAIPHGVREEYPDVGRRVQFVFKNCNFLFGMNSDGDKIYMKIVSFDEIYNFVGQTFFI
jgi:hypothetical protein